MSFTAEKVVIIKKRNQKKATQAIYFNSFSFFTFEIALMSLFEKNTIGKMQIVCKVQYEIEDTMEIW